MHCLSFLIVGILVFFSFCSHSVDNPLLIIVLMVKNEAPVIASTLESYIGNRDVGYFIFDTGSTDDTIERVEIFFRDHSIEQYALAREPFVDFATSRNRGLRLAEQRFPYARFLLMPDAEWHLSGLDRLVEFCRQEKYSYHPAYLVDIHACGIDFTTPRLIRTHRDVRFEGVVHEIIATTGVKAPQEVRFDMIGTEYGGEKTRKRWVRDAELLLKHFQENPNDSRTAFYLAQTYHCLDDLENAQKYYEIRSTLAGWGEENFMTWYRLGQVLESRAEHEENEAFWYYAQNCYLKAYSIRPERAESLVKLAEHYIKDDAPLAYLFAKHAVEIPYPDKDILFLEKERYRYTVHDLLGIASWYMRNYDLGKESVKKAIQARGKLPHLVRNLSLYEEALIKN